jgi:hypothetical protein
VIEGLEMEISLEELCPWILKHIAFLLLLVDEVLDFLVLVHLVSLADDFRGERRAARMSRLDVPLSLPREDLSPCVLVLNDLLTYIWASRLNTHNLSFKSIVEERVPIQC